MVKWKGYSHKQNTWEPEVNLEQLKDLVDEFEAELAAGNLPDLGSVVAPSTPGSARKRSSSTSALATKSMTSPRAGANRKRATVEAPHIKKEEDSGDDEPATPPLAGRPKRGEAVGRELPQPSRTSFGRPSRSPARFRPSGR